MLLEVLAIARRNWRHGEDILQGGFEGHESGRFSAIRLEVKVVSIVTMFQRRCLVQSHGEGANGSMVPRSQSIAGAGGVLRWLCSASVARLVIGIVK